MKIIIWIGTVIVMGLLFMIRGKGVIPGMIILGICIPTAKKLCDS